MTLGQLAYFVAVVEHGSFTRAARALHVSQPALSHQIAQLEREAGESLLERLPRSVGPPRWGSNCCRTRGRRWPRRTKRTLRRARSASCGRACCGSARCSRSRSGSSRRRSAPGARRIPGRDRAARVRERRDADAGDARGRRGRRRRPAAAALARRPARDRLRGVRRRAEPRDPLLAQTTIRLAQLKDRPWVLYAPEFGLSTLVPDACAAAGFAPRPAARTHHTATALELAAAGVGPALVPTTSSARVRGDDAGARPARDPRARRLHPRRAERAGSRPSSTCSCARDAVSAARRRERPQTRAETGLAAAEPRRGAATRLLPAHPPLELSTSAAVIAAGPNAHSSRRTGGSGQATAPPAASAIMLAGASAGPRPAAASRTAVGRVVGADRGAGRAARRRAGPFDDRRQRVSWAYSTQGGRELGQARPAPRRSHSSRSTTTRSSSPSTRTGAVPARRAAADPHVGHAAAHLLGELFDVHVLEHLDAAARVARRHRGSRAGACRWRSSTASRSAAPHRRRAASGAPARRAAARTRRAGRTRAPSASGTRRGAARSSSGWPTLRSSARTWCDSAGWETSSRRAASVNDPSSTTASRYSSCRSDIAP